ncbi:MAG: immunoglobulin domain-containing protein [Opitutaceae bacterium]|nr:immunoglobulin domain-containing protein [Opitutaceae bacterium]
MKSKIYSPDLPFFQSWCSRRRLALTALLLLGSALMAATGNVPRAVYPESILEVAERAPAGRLQPRIMRMALSADETTATLDFQVALKMRNFAELQARIARGEIISREEMAAKYFPLAADYEQMAAWLAAKGFTITQANATRLSVFARGPVSRIAEVFQTTFARVAYEGGEYTSAVTAPSVPIGLAPAVLGINGLQPHLRPHKFANQSGVQKASLTSPYAPPYIPSEILKAYNANAAGVTGAGQTIAIVIDTYVTPSDLTTFWSRCNINQSIDNVQRLHVPGAPTPPDPAAVDDSGVPYGAEATIDAELTSSVAPAAKIRVYTTGELDFVYLSQAYQQIYDDATSHPEMALHQVNLSYGIRESGAPDSWKQSDAQNFAALASAGVTVFASTGDGGSNPDSSGGYSASAPAQPSYPASDQSITSVGATTLNLTSSGTTSSETGWSVSTSSRGQSASGGGSSAYFSRPDWQTGPGVQAGTMRLVPDLAVVGDPYTGAYIVLTSQQDGQTAWQFGGTSISAPIWAGFGALINQARANAGLPPIGLFGPKLYPLLGTASLRDITSGTNGIYNAGTGHDLVTGVGTPDVAVMIQNLALQNPTAPEVTTQPVSQTVIPGQNASFTVSASGNPSPSYQWQRQPTGTTSWSNLTASSTYSDTGTASLTVNLVTEAMNGDLFQCVVSNSSGSVTTAPPAALIVTYPLSITTLAGTAGSSGSTDGTGAAARFNHPSDVALDSSGNLYVSDTNNHTIRKITSGGTVSTLAGLAGTSGSANGTDAARFNSPTGLTADASGNLYVADTDNHAIRKIVIATREVATVATGFNLPSDVAADGSGNLYVADTGNHTIRKIAPNGVVTTLAGLAGVPGSANGAGILARFSSPEGVTVDGAGNVYVADTNNHTIRKITPDGTVSTLAGLAGTSGTGDGAGSAARFQYPSDLMVDGSGNLFVADTDNHAIRKLTSAGLTGTVAGLTGTSGSADGVGSTARFLYPTGVAVDSTGNIYIADTSNHTIRKGVVASKPLITEHPQSQTVTAGANVSFSVTAAGEPAPTYQWNFNGTAISGATSSTYSLFNVQSSHAGNYTVTVTNATGSVTSSTATLTVNAAPPPPPSGGGGGAFEAWFVLALALLGATRLVARHGRSRV